MNKVVKRGFSVWKIFLKNKLAGSFMMLFSGVMMFYAALNGKGNDTKTLPIAITVVGAVLTLFGAYRIGYVKANFDKIDKTNREEKDMNKKALLMQIAETLAYLIVVGLGVFLLTNEGFMNKVLNLMAGGFTTLNGVLNVIKLYKNREKKDSNWRLIFVLMVLELIIGLYFIFASDSIGIEWYIIMGALTTAAGIIEVVSAMTRDNLRCTVDDGKEIVRIIKDGDAPKGDAPKNIEK